MSKPIVISKYFSSSTTTITVITKRRQEEEEEKEPTSERSQHTDTDLNEQLSEWTVDTHIQKEQVFKELSSEKESDHESDDNGKDLNWSIEGKAEPVDNNDELNISEVEEEMIEEENGEEELDSIDTQPLDINQQDTKRPLHSLDLNRFKITVEKTDNKSDLNPTTTIEKPKFDLSKFKAPTGPLDLNQFKAPSDPRYKSRIPPKKPKARKQVPSFKYLQDTKFVVDAFSYGQIPNCDGYFLTHFHTDHYGGLKSNWTHGPIYCSRITANLVRQQLNVEEHYIHPLPMDTLVSVTDKVRVGLIDANHCPGSVLFLFVIENDDGKIVRHLHTGDFRASPRMCLHPLLRQPENPPLDNVYLDTTYMDPKYAFPAQEECIEAVCDLVKKECASKRITSFMESWTKRPKTMQRVLVVIGAYKIGKERVFYNVAKMLDSKIYVTDDRKQILDCQENKDIADRLINDPLKAQIHVVQLNTIKGDNMREYLEKYKSAFDRIIAIKPTGWAYKSSLPSTVQSTSLYDVVVPPTERSLPLSPSCNWDNIQIYGVPYSEHSSFRELASFIATLESKRIIPTVKTPEEMIDLLEQWQGERVVGRAIDCMNEDHW
ncbi:DRMBL-domain-containing protein [Backusella circina FSU 941]|nr:DRMBL-domain-containing protein [Backusella circina FSU 941]